MHITASVFINDDAGLWAGPVWRPVAEPHRSSLPQASPSPEQSEGTMPTPREAGKSICFPSQVMGREVVMAVSNSRLDFGTWERIFQGQVEGLARES